MTISGGGDVNFRFQNFVALFVNSAFRPILEVGWWWTRVAEVDGSDLASCHNWWVRHRNCACNTLGNKSTKKVPRREVESFFREERNVTTGLVSFTHHRIQIITILVGTDIAKITFNIDSFWWSCCRRSCPSSVPCSRRSACCLSTSTGSWPSTWTTSKPSTQPTTIKGSVDCKCGADNAPRHYQSEDSGLTHGQSGDICDCGRK